MRRTVLLLVVTAAALLTTGGAALAADVSCPNRSAPVCAGTDDADVITGSAQDDDIRARNGDDGISALGGHDRILGGEGDDTSDGGTGRDGYVFSGAWGDDTITADASGRDAVRFSRVAPGGVNVALGGGQPGATDGVSTVEFAGDFIEIVLGTPGSDNISGNSSINRLTGFGGVDILEGAEGDDFLYGGSQNDTLYGGPGGDFYVTNAGGDTVDDASGSNDELALGSRSSGAATFTPVDGPDSDGFYEDLSIDLGSGSSVLIKNYFDNAGSRASTSGPGTGLIENIAFSDGGLGFSDVQSLIASGEVEANDDSATTEEDTPVSIEALSNDSGRNLTVEAGSLGDPTNGTVRLVTGSGPDKVEYTPDPDYNNTSSTPDSFTYRACNDAVPATCDPATVSVTVTSVDDPPDAQDDTATAEEGGAPVDIDVLANDADPDGGAGLTITGFTQPTPANSGSVSCTSSGCTFTPDADFNGQTTFTYTVSDGTGSDTATVTVTVTATNDNPGALDDTETTDEDTARLVDVLANDTIAPDTGETLSIQSVTDPANGATSISAGKVLYEPDADYFGPDTFDYTVSDGNGGTATATVRMTVKPVNDAPTAGNDSYSGAIGNTKFAVGITNPAGPVVAKTGDVLDNDADDNLENDTLSVTAGQITTQNNGTVDMNADGSFTYLPRAGYKGTDTFTYQVCDDGESGDPPAPDPKCASGTATVGVTDMVWYVDNSASSGGDGRSASPFTGLGSLQGASDPDGNGDYIFVYQGNANYTGGITLESDQKLTGQGVALVVGTNTLVEAGGRPTIVNAPGNGITLASNNTVRGLNVGDTSGSGIKGTNVNDATMNNISVSGFNGGAAVDLSGGNGTVTYDGTISNTAGRAVSVVGRAGGSVSFGGDIASTGNGILVQNNTIGTNAITFSGANKTLNTGANQAVTLINNIGTTVSFTNGGLDIDTAGGAGFTAYGGATLNVSGPNNTLNSTSATALVLSNVTIGASDATFASVTSGGGTNNVDIGDVSGGVVAMNGGALSGASDRAFNVFGGNANITYAGTISNSSRGIRVANRAGGAVTFSGANKTLNTGANPAVTLDNNDPGTIKFTNGGLGITTTSGKGFDATSGATAIEVTGSNNTISSNGGVALNVSNSNIGSDGLNFKSISANGGANGIVLNSTGTSGGLTVTGDGSTANSGGTITQSATGTAVSLTNASNVQLKLMKLSVTSTSGTGLIATNLSGTNSLEKSVVDFNNTVAAGSYALRLANTSTNATLTLDGTTFQNKQDGTTAVSVSAMGSSVMTVNVRDSNTGDPFESKYTNLFGSGIVMGAGDDAGSTANVHFNVSDTKFVNAPSNGLNNLEMGVGANATLIPNISNNTFDKIGLPLATVGVINLNAFAGGRVGSDAEFGLVSGNTITNVRSGAGPTFAYDPNGTNGYLGMRFAIDNPGVTGINHRLKIANNNISNMARQGILVSAREQATNTNVVITNNQVGTPAAPVGLSNRRGIELEAQETAVLNALVDNNTVYGFGSSGSNAALAVRAGVAGDLGDPTTSTVNATVTNNTLRSTNGSATGGAAFRAETISGNSGTMCLDLRANTLGFTANANTPVFELNNNSGTFRVEGAGTGAVTSGNIASTNNGFGATFLGSVVFNNNANCTQPGF